MLPNHQPDLNLLVEILIFPLLNSVVNSLFKGTVVTTSCVPGWVSGDKPWGRGEHKKAESSVSSPPSDWMAPWREGKRDGLETRSELTTWKTEGHLHNAFTRARNRTVVSLCAFYCCIRFLALLVYDYCLGVMQCTQVYGDTCVNTQAHMHMSCTPPLNSLALNTGVSMHFSLTDSCLFKEDL